MLDQLLSGGASISFYMGHGGTNWGFWNGANGGDVYTATITSYDYDSPISEGGEHGYGSEGKDKYTAIKETIIKYVDAESIPPEPPLPPRGSIGSIPLTDSIGLFDALEVLAFGPPIHHPGPRPPHMEAVNQSQGFIMYTTWIGPKHSKTNLTLGGVHDRAQVWVGTEAVGTVYRSQLLHLTLPSITKSEKLVILIENLGRVNFGPQLYDPKGLYGGDVTVDDEPLTGWEVVRLPLESQQIKDLIGEIGRRGHRQGGESGFSGIHDQPRFYFASFRVDRAVDTYLDMQAWTKGVVWMNGNPLGRYWSIGPQQALWCPALYLHQDVENDLVMIELHGPPSKHVIETLDVPIFATL